MLKIFIIYVLTQPKAHTLFKWFITMLNYINPCRTLLITVSAGWTTEHLLLTSFSCLLSNCLFKFPPTFDFLYKLSFFLCSSVWQLNQSPSTQLQNYILFARFWTRTCTLFCTKSMVIFFFFFFCGLPG